MFIKMPDNEWVTASYYEYNYDQDQTQKEIKRKIEDGEFVKDEDYDDNGYSNIPLPIRLKPYTNPQRREEYAQNARYTKPVLSTNRQHT